MHDFGSFTAYSDPRIYGLIENYRWGDFQRSLLLGQHSWVSSTWGTDRRGFRLKACNAVVHCLRERGIKIGMSESSVALIRADLPADDPTLPILLAQWGLVIPRVRILVLEGPLETIGSVPIFKAQVFGYTERASGERRHGLNDQAWIVGRTDVREVCRSPHSPGWTANAGAVIAPELRVRGTLRKARNVARTVAKALPDWDAYSQSAAKQEMADPQARLEVERHILAVADEDVANFAA